MRNAVRCVHHDHELFTGVFLTLKLSGFDHVTAGLANAKFVDITVDADAVKFGLVRCVELEASCDGRICLFCPRVASASL